MTERRRIDHWRNKSWASPCLFAMKSLAVHQGNSRDPANPVKSLRRERERVRDETKVTLMPTGNQKRKDASTREEKPKCVGGKIPPIPIIYLFDKSEWSDQSDDVQDFWFSNRRASLLSSLFVGPLQTAEYSSDPISFCSAQHSIILRASVADDIKNHFPSPPSQTFKFGTTHIYSAKISSVAAAAD